MTFDSGARLELMQREDIFAYPAANRELPGYAHLALEVGDEGAVDSMARRLTDNGFRLIDGPRRTGDGYYECVVLDPDGNRLELSATIEAGKHQ